MNLRKEYVDIAFSFTYHYKGSIKQANCTLVIDSRKTISINKIDGPEVIRCSFDMFKQLMYDKKKDHYPLFNEAYKHLNEILDKLDEISSKA